MELHSTRYRIEDRSAVITLHRPDRGNAWTGRIHAEYKHCLIRPSAIPTSGPSWSPARDGFAYHFALTKPIIAAINGPSAGIGWLWPVSPTSDSPSPGPL